MKFIISAIFSTLLLSASAVDRPEGLARSHIEHARRELQLFSGDARCEKQLSACEAFTMGIGIDERANNWIRFVSGLDGDDTDTLVDDFLVILDRSAAVDFSPIVDRLVAAAQGGRAANLVAVLRNILGEVRSIDAQDADTEMTLESVTQATEDIYEIIEQTIGGLPPIDISTIILILTFVIDLFGVLTSGEGIIAIVSLIIGFIIEYLGSLSVNLMALNIFPDTDPECMKELMLCDYTKMVVQVAPGLFGSLLLAVGESAGSETFEPSGI